MSLFRHQHEGTERPEEAASFEVLGPDGTVERYAREQFDQIFVTTDRAEMQRQVDLGWIVLDERQVEGQRRGPSGEDLIPGIEGLRVGGVLGYEASEEVTSYVLGYLRDGARGEPADSETITDR